MIRDIKYIVVHCTATPPETTIASIQRYWREEKGWKNPGYHYIIERSGNIVNLLPEECISNGVKGYNTHAVHISYIGGIDTKGNALDNRTEAQVQAMYNKLVELSAKYPHATILGHRDFPGVSKFCPSFNVKEWIANYNSDLAKAA